jgi:hypothetical protein
MIANVTAKQISKEYPDLLTSKGRASKESSKKDSKWSLWSDCPIRRRPDEDRRLAICIAKDVL